MSNLQKKERKYIRKEKSKIEKVSKMEAIIELAFQSSSRESTLLSDQTEINEIRPEKLEQEFLAYKNRSKAWSPEEDEQLRVAVGIYNGRNWKKIAEKVIGRTASQCSQRWRRLKPHKIRQPWTQEEDLTIIDLAEQRKCNWSLISQKIPGRTGKQIRERFLNKLDPKINKRKWTSDEDEIVIKYLLQYGPRWSQISRHLDGRPENIVKNRFYSYIKRKYFEGDLQYLMQLFQGNQSKLQLFLDLISKHSQNNNNNNNNDINNKINIPQQKQLQQQQQYQKTEEERKNFKRKNSIDLINISEQPKQQIQTEDQEDKINSNYRQQIEAVEQILSPCQIQQNNQILDSLFLFQKDKNILYSQQQNDIQLRKKFTQKNDEAQLIRDLALINMASQFNQLKNKLNDMQNTLAQIQQSTNNTNNNNNNNNFISIQEPEKMNTLQKYSVNSNSNNNNVVIHEPEKFSNFQKYSLNNSNLLQNSFNNNNNNNFYDNNKIINLLSSQNQGNFQGIFNSNILENQLNQSSLIQPLAHYSSTNQTQSINSLINSNNKSDLFQSSVKFSTTNNNKNQDLHFLDQIATVKEDTAKLIKTTDTFTTINNNNNNEKRFVETTKNNNQLNEFNIMDSMVKSDNFNVNQLHQQIKDSLQSMKSSEIFQSFAHNNVNKNINSNYPINSCVFNDEASNSNNNNNNSIEFQELLESKIQKYNQLLQQQKIIQFKMMEVQSQITNIQTKNK